MSEPVGKARALLVRHGATEWSTTGRHTGRTDLPLLPEGNRQAEALAAVLAGVPVARVLCSPLLRARETARLAGLGDRAEALEDLREWDYGEYEGRTTAAIRRQRPGWTPWRDGFPGGETLESLGARADRVVAQVRLAEGLVVLFGHGHILRVIAARWLALDPGAGALLALAAGSISLLGWEHGSDPVISAWNVDAAGQAAVVWAG